MTVDVDKLPITQYLALEVLAARHRLGEQLWTFPSRMKFALLALADAGLIDVMSGVVSRTLRARLTDAGRAAVLYDGYQPPSVPAQTGIFIIGGVPMKPGVMYRAGADGRWYEVADDGTETEVGSDR